MSPIPYAVPALALTLAAIAAPTAASTRPKLIELTGAIEAAADLEALINEAEPVRARPDGTPTRVVLRLQSPDIRDDLAFRLLDWIGRSPAETLVYLDGPRNQQLASTLLAVSLASDHAAVAPKAAFARRGDRTARALAPEPPSWGTLELDINRLTASALAASERPPLAVHLAGIPREPVWLGPDGGLLAEPGDGPADQIAFVDAAHPLPVELSPDAVAAVFGLPVHRSITSAVRALDWPTPRQRVRLDASLAPRHERLARLVTAAKAQAAEAEHALDPDLYRRGDEPVRAWHHQQALARSAPAFERARLAHAEAAELVRRYPELLRLPVAAGFDGAAELSADPDDRARAWARLLTALERELNDLADDTDDARRAARSP